MKKQNGIFEAVLLELLSYVPVVLILGNVLPPLGSLKIHWIYLGVIFLNTLVLLCKSKRALILLVITFIFLLINLLVSIKFSVGEFIDFLAGPFLLVAVVNIVITDKFEERKLRWFRKKLLFSLSVPVLIGFFQFVGIMPLEFLNAKYVNTTVFGSTEIERINGYLFHGIELAVIIIFLFANLSLLTRNTLTYQVLFIMAFLEYITFIKTGIITAVLFIVYYSYFIDRKLRSLKSILIGSVLLFGFSYLFILVPDLEADRFHFDASHFTFEDQLFTGRGFIWNTYLRGILDFEVLQVLFGAGFGSAPLIFEKNVIGNTDWIPGPHNQLLDLFINGGLAAISFIVVILFAQYKKLKHYFAEDGAAFSRYYIGVILIPLLVMGLTAPIMSMFVYWCGLSLTILCLKLSPKQAV
ncbi:MAG: O-antigen ligase family protein [Cyclobacteriaceae bacterium]|nr:O-antigen ligase family protein [Cyclobacteriaceae bacterium]